MLKQLSLLFQVSAPSKLFATSEIRFVERHIALPGEWLINITLLFATAVNKLNYRASSGNFQIRHLYDLWLTASRFVAVNFPEIVMIQ